MGAQRTIGWRRVVRYRTQTWMPPELPPHNLVLVVHPNTQYAPDAAYFQSCPNPPLQTNTHGYAIGPKEAMKLTNI